jgi:hypothetical protein
VTHRRSWIHAICLASCWSDPRVKETAPTTDTHQVFPKTLSLEQWDESMRSADEPTCPRCGARGDVWSDGGDLDTSLYDFVCGAKAEVPFDSPDSSEQAYRQLLETCPHMPPLAPRFRLWPGAQ